MRRVIYDYFFLFLVLGVFGGILWLLAPFAGDLFGALICATTFHPLHKRLRRWFPKTNPAVPATLADIFVFIFFVTPLAFLTWAIFQESTTLTAVVKQGSSAVDQWRSGSVFDTSPWIGEARFFLQKTLGIRSAQFQGTVITALNKMLETLSLTGTMIATHAVAFAFHLFVMFFALFFFFKDGDKMLEVARHILPIRRQYREKLMTRMYDAVNAIVWGLLMSSLAQGIAATLGYFIIRADGAVLLGALTTLAGILPVIGTFSIWGSVGLFFLLKGSYLKGIFIWLWGALVVVGFMDTIVRPLWVGKKTKMPTMALFFALLGGVATWGVKGLIIGPLLIALAPVLFQIYREHYLQRYDALEPDIPEPRHTVPLNVNS